MSAGSMTATPESVWAAFKETDRQLKKSSADFHRRLKENERLLMEQRAETEKIRAETERLRAETEKLRAESDRQWKESCAKTDRQWKESCAETDRQWRESCAEYNRRMKRFDETVGSLTNNIGAFAEEYFFNSFDKGEQTFFGETFDKIRKNVRGFNEQIEDEYDIVLINGKSIGIVEVKFKAHKNDIPDVIKKAETFRAIYPTFAHHQIYLGLATMSFYPDLEQECINQGIAVIKQVGDTVVINDGHLKVY